VRLFARQAEVAGFPRLCNKGNQGLHPLWKRRSPTAFNGDRACGGFPPCHVVVRRDLFAMVRTAMIALALNVACYSLARAEAACAINFERHIKSASCLMPPAVATFAKWRVADVLCCCKTHTGGECCTRVAKCGGKPPGCFCALPSVPSGAQQLSSTARDH
jgi:hypothetical protein